MYRVYDIVHSQGLTGEYLALFAATEVFIFVFIEIITKIDMFCRVIFHEAKLLDLIIFIIVLGAFSIFGTYVGIPVSSGAIINIRDLAPILAGLTAGPVAGVAVGLIGGIHRFFMGGITALSCSLSTVLAGVIGGGVYLLNKRKLVKLFPAVGLAVAVELLHGGLTLLIARPFDQALEIVKIAIPQMLIANAIGIALCVIIIHNASEIRELKERQNRNVS
jgi:sigma-B regulation protein RsbU (phosphoserine phosphatase)